MKSRQDDVETWAAVEREELETSVDYVWFSIDRSQTARKVTTLTDSPWFDSSDTAITPADLEIELEHRLIPHLTGPPTAEEVRLSEETSEDWTSDDWTREDLLVSGTDVLVTRLTRDGWSGSQLLIVQNGSFLLNLSLVNREHRLLAGKLIDEVESRGGVEQQVVFLESDQGGPKILDEDPKSNLPTGPINEPPVSYIVYHLIVIGVLAIFACWPIFGRPRELPSAARSDFGEHVRSLGAMLGRSRDETYCRTRLLHYEQTSRGESGAATARPKRPQDELE